MPSLRSGIPWGGENEQKWRSAIVLKPKSKLLRNFMSYFKTCALKQALCAVFRNPYSLRSHLGIKKGAFSPFFVHSAES
jgi:hypothetical protein